MHSLLRHPVVTNLLFAIAYLTLAKFGFAWGALTNNATLLWPPSGLTVFGCLVFGSRANWGLLLGAIAANQFLSLSPPLGYTFFSFFIAAINGTSSFLQGYLIAKFARKLYLRKFKIASQHALRFTLTVLFCCTLASTVSNVSLWQAQVITLNTALQSWAVWWLGDSIGVLISTPILLWLYYRITEHKHSQTHAFLIFCAGVGTVLLTVAAIGHNEREAHRKNLSHDAENIVNNLQANINWAMRDLETLQEYFVNNTPDREDFRNLVEPLLKRNLWLDSFSWIPVQNQDQNKPTIDFLAGLQLAHLADGTFLWKQPDQATYSAAAQNQLLNELKPTQSDVFWRRDTLENNRYYASPHMHLIEPIAFCGAAKRSDCQLFNLVSSELDLNNLMRLSPISTPLSALDLTLVTVDSHQRIIKLKWNLDRWEQGDETYSALKTPITVNNELPSITFFNQHWQVLVTTKDYTIWFLPSLLQIFVLTIGFALVGLLSAYLQALHRQDELVIENQSRLEDEIKAQTQALRISNETLTKEIEEKRITQEQLKASEAHMRTLLDNIPDPIWFKSSEGKYLNFNKAVSSLLLSEQGDVVGKTVNDFYDPQLANTIQDFETSVLLSEHSGRMQLWMHIPLRNEKRLMDTIKVAVRDENKNTIGILSIARDITDQFLLIDELEKFKRFAEYASEGFSILSLETKTLYMNKSLKKMLKGKQPSDKEHIDFSDYFPADLLAQWQDHIFPQILLHGFWQGELAALRADGSRFPTKETFFIIRDDRGNALYLGEVMSDISDQKQVESALQLAKETAEEATRAKSRFLANMSHEIRTPLNAVLGYSQLLMSDNTLSPQQHERMNAILNAGQRLLHLINDILDLSKIEAGALHFRQDYFDLHQELNDIIALMSTKAMAKGLSLNHIIKLPSPAIIKSDRQKIGQIILNLLGNAIKFTPTGDVTLEVHLDEQHIYFNVIDTGPGISAQELQLLFAAFKQGKSGEESGGTGLGLVISKHIAEHLGGQLTLESEQGAGTRAHLRLPITLEYGHEIHSQEPVKAAKLKSNSLLDVLVIEDDFSSRDLMVNLLNNMGCQVRAAINGKEGLAEAARQKPDIIFTDIRMPELNGTDMLIRLREIYSSEQLPVIAVSASSLEHERTFYLSQGFQEFIGKPYQFNDIYKTIASFTKAEFAENPLASSQTNADIQDTIDWRIQQNTAQMQQQLLQFKSALNAGDMMSSKKQFAQLSAESLGKLTHAKIQTAIKQYDLVQAEKFVEELLIEINHAISANSSQA